jgi:hypothetical protein
MTHTAFPIATQAGKTAARLLHKLATALKRLVCTAVNLESFRIYF